MDLMRLQMETERMKQETEKKRQDFYSKAGIALDDGSANFHIMSPSLGVNSEHKLCTNIQLGSGP